jgi:protein-disulfide isomerase
MIRCCASRLQNYPRPGRAGLLLSLASAALLATAAAGAHAQFSAPSSGTQVHDTSALHPPAGARVAIVEFADMECSACASANPILKQIVAQYKIPWVRHDFLISAHAWSATAAMNARWFDSKSKALGDEYRDQVFSNQPSFYNNPELLHQFTDQFAQSHHIALPFALDPQGKLMKQVSDDNDLGIRTGVKETPTIWVVTANSKGAPYIKVTDRSKLSQIIDKALADTAPVHNQVAKPASNKTSMPAAQ